MNIATGREAIFSTKESKSMGALMTLPYANIFMARPKEIILKIRHHYLLFWKRFINDIFFIFQGKGEIIYFILTLLKRFTKA